MKKLKCYVLIHSVVFPSIHPRAGQPTNFFQSIEKGEKIHTIRANYEYWKNVVDQVNAGKAYISRRYWTGLPYKSKQKEHSRIYKAGIEKIHLHNKNKEYIKWQVNNQSTYCKLHMLAQNDGLSYQDFLGWFFPYKSLTPQAFTGAIIHYTPYRYLYEPTNSMLIKNVVKRHER